MQRAQYAFKRLPVTAMILGWPSTEGQQFRTRVIARVSVQPLFQRTGGQAQSLPARRHLHGFEIQILDGLVA